MQCNRRVAGIAASTVAMLLRRLTTTSNNRSFWKCERSHTSGKRNSTQPTALFKQRCYMTTYKSSTGLVGLTVDPNGKETMQRICIDVLTGVRKLPPNSEYRTSTEEWFEHLQAVLASTDDVRLWLKHTHRSTHIQPHIPTCTYPHTDSHN